MEEREWREFAQRVIETVKWCEERNESPLVWATAVGRLAMAVPSPELGQVLVSHLCFDHNRPQLWKFIEKSLSSGLLFPIHVLSLLSARVIPNRRSQPKAYTVYLELLSRYALSFTSLPQDVSKEKLIEDIDQALRLSQLYDVPISTLELGHVFVLFLFRIVDSLIDVVLDDWGLLKTPSDRSRLSFGTTDHTDMDIDSNESNSLEKMDNCQGGMRMTNTIKVMEVLGKITESKKSVLLLRLVHINMPEKFDGLQYRLDLLKSHWLSSSDLKTGAQLFAQFHANIQRVVGFQHQKDKRHLMGVLIENGFRKPLSICNFRSDISACWISIDVYLENALDGKQLPVKSFVDVLAEGIKTLQVVNQATWQETFLAIWLSSLRLVQRVEITPYERDPLEGPIPHLETRLCVLLSIIPLSIAKVLNVDMQLPVKTVPGHGNDTDEKDRFPRKHGLVLALQVLEQFSTLVCPPECVVDAANTAATKAAHFVQSSRNEDLGVDSVNYNQGSVNVGGNMRHLIVEACIARNLLDTSAYFWPDYIPASAFSPSEPTPTKSPWLAFLDGAPLSGSLVNSLVSTPAPSLVEIEKLYDIAINGSEEEKPAAAQILCGASLINGWTIQEHVVRFVVKLLAPPLPPNHSGSRSHLVDYMPMLSEVLYRASSVDMVHILSLHGAIPEVAASLMPLCEVFGSLEPRLQNKSTTEKDEPSVYMVYSLAFLFLLRLWKFYRPPVEQCITEYARVNGVQLNLEYLLFMHNSRSLLLSNNAKDYDKAVYVDSFPKLRRWYLQNKACVAAKLSCLSTENPAYQVANTILNMIYSKMTLSGSTSSLSSNCSSPTSMGEDVFQQTLHIPAWQVLEAIPYVLDALLAACSYGRISSRSLITGLRDFVDYLPATLAVIISYFSAEVTRGIWKPVPMNGIDWPSPAPVMQLVDSEIKAILAAIGVDMPSCLPSCSSEGSQITLPLPMAVLVSLTITFKLDKNLEYIHAVAGPALESCASGCPWPGMAIVGCLWAQKIRRWHDFIVVSSSRSVFRHSKEAVAQLLRSCFSAYLGTAATSSSMKRRAVDGLLGHVISASTAPPSVAPGFLFLRSCRTIQNVVIYVNDVIIRLVAEHSRIGSSSQSSSSFESSVARVREAATLGSSLVCVAGGYRLVQELYTQTIPTWLLSPRDSPESGSSGGEAIMEGYAVACLAFHSGCLMWGLQEKRPKGIYIKRLRILGVHMDFLAQVLEGKVSLGSDPATWKTYVSCFVGLMVRFAPGWIPDLKQRTLRTLASGLRGWREYGLALLLLEKGGVEAMGPAAELANIIGSG